MPRKVCSLVNSTVQCQFPGFATVLQLSKLLPLGEAWLSIHGISGIFAAYCTALPYRTLSRNNFFFLECILESLLWDSAPLLFLKPGDLSPDPSLLMPLDPAS